MAGKSKKWFLDFYITSSTLNPSKHQSVDMTNITQTPDNCEGTEKAMRLSSSPCFLLAGCIILRISYWLAA
jgi:hypothetical protein